MQASEIARLIIHIEEKVNSDSVFYGKLLKWGNGEDDWHYGIGLSNIYFFNTGSTKERELKILKRHDIHDIIEQRDIDIREIPGVESPFDSDEVIERLKYALRWLIDLPENSSQLNNLNGKQLASLIFANKTDSITENNQHTLLIKRDIDFQEYLDENSPKLKRHKIGRFMKKGRNLVYVLSFLFPLSIIVLIPTLSGVLLGIFALILSLLLVSISDFKWSGFQRRSLWDWLQLLIVPLILVVGAFSLNVASNVSAERIAEERKQQEILKDYFSKMQALILAEKTINKDEKKADLTIPKLSAESQAIGRALTLAVLEELEGKRKSKIITFLVELGLITNVNSRKKPEISLRLANLRNVELIGLDQSGVVIKEADMTEAKLTNVTLENSDFSGSNLSDSTLKNVDFNKADLRNVNLNGATLDKIKLKDAQFSNTCYNLKTNGIIEVEVPENNNIETSPITQNTQEFKEYVKGKSEFTNTTSAKDKDCAIKIDNKKPNLNKKELQKG